MFGNNNSCTCVIIVLLILLLFCGNGCGSCGNGGSVGGVTDNNCGCC